MWFPVFFCRRFWFGVKLCDFFARQLA